MSDFFKWCHKVYFKFLIFLKAVITIIKEGKSQNNLMEVVKTQMI